MKLVTGQLTPGELTKARLALLTASHRTTNAMGAVGGDLYGPWAPVAVAQKWIRHVIDVLEIIDQDLRAVQTGSAYSKNNLSFLAISAIDGEREAIHHRIGIIMAHAGRFATESFSFLVEAEKFLHNIGPDEVPIGSSNEVVWRGLYTAIEDAKARSAALATIMWRGIPSVGAYPSPEAIVLAGLQARSLIEHLDGALRTAADFEARFLKSENAAKVDQAMALYMRTASRLVRMATLALPAAHRDRYHEEFSAELWELKEEGATAWRQLTHALRLLEQCFILRKELKVIDAATEGDRIGT